MGFCYTLHQLGKLPDPLALLRWRFFSRSSTICIKHSSWWDSMNKLCLYVTLYSYIGPLHTSSIQGCSVCHHAVHFAHYSWRYLFCENHVCHNFAGYVFAPRARFPCNYPLPLLKYYIKWTSTGEARVPSMSMMQGEYNAITSLLFKYMPLIDLPRKSILMLCSIIVINK